MEASASRTDQLRASPPMFENRWLDRLSRVHPATPLFIYVPVIVVLLADAAGRMAAWAVVVAVVAGYLVWTLAEYRLPRVGFGVSAPWWDHVFGTATRPRRRPTT